MLSGDSSCLEVNLTSFPPKCFFLKNKKEIFKTVPMVCFLSSACFEKKKTIQNLAIEKWPIISRSDAKPW